LSPCLFSCFWVSFSLIWIYTQMFIYLFFFIFLFIFFFQQNLLIICNEQLFFRSSFFFFFFFTISLNFGISTKGVCKTTSSLERSRLKLACSSRFLIGMHLSLLSELALPLLLKIDQFPSLFLLFFSSIRLWFFFFVYYFFLFIIFDPFIYLFAWCFVFIMSSWLYRSGI